MMYYVNLRLYLIKRVSTLRLSPPPCFHVYVLCPTWRLQTLLSLFLMEGETNVCYHFHAAAVITRNALEFISRNTNGVLFSTWIFT